VICVVEITEIAENTGIAGNAENAEIAGIAENAEIADVVEDGVDAADDSDCDLVAELRARLTDFGYAADLLAEETDATLQRFLARAKVHILYVCGGSEVPEVLHSAWLDLAAGDYLAAKLTFMPEIFADRDLHLSAVKMGDVSMSYANNEAAADERVMRFVEDLQTQAYAALTNFRGVRW
jgi:hypothetical protein